MLDSLQTVSLWKQSWRWGWCASVNSHDGHGSMKLRDSELSTCCADSPFHPLHSQPPPPPPGGYTPYHCSWLRKGAQPVHCIYVRSGDQRHELRLGPRCCCSIHRVAPVLPPTASVLAGSISSGQWGQELFYPPLSFSVATPLCLYVIFLSIYHGKTCLCLIRKVVLLG